MILTQKLKSLEKQIVFMKWGNSSNYGKIKYVGSDFIEFEVINTKNLTYHKTVIINPNLILEIVLGSDDINRIIAEVSCKLPSYGEEKIN